ncbi:MAG: IS1595 family transposase [Chitinophagaceae bacterium]
MPNCAASGPGASCANVNPSLYSSSVIPVDLGSLSYRISVAKKAMSSNELSRELSLRQKTCWAFKRKVQESMSSSVQFALEGNVDVYEFVVGGTEEGAQGRSKGDKKIVVVALERRDNGQMGRAYGMTIDNDSADEIGKLLARHVSAEAAIRTDGWTAYEKLGKNGILPNNYLKREKILEKCTY